MYYYNFICPPPPVFRLFSDKRFRFLLGGEVNKLKQRFKIYKIGVAIKTYKTIFDPNNNNEDSDKLKKSEVYVLGCYKVYLGQTSRLLLKRFWEHKWGGDNKLLMHYVRGILQRRDIDW